MKSDAASRAEAAAEADRYRGALLGLATGDALGTTLESARPGSFEPITDLVGGGPFHLTPGAWTDDTSMALCLAQSLVERGGFDARDQIERYCRWQDTGDPSSTDTCFGIGNTVAAALDAYRATGDPLAGATAPDTAGNGSLMRLAPVVLFFAPHRERAARHAAASSRTTHGAPECLDACAIFAAFLLRALAGEPRRAVLAPVPGRFASPALDAIAACAFVGKPRDAIRGSGYVVDCLEAALWCFSETRSFRNAVLLAANLGDDADTTAAVCGQLAGAHYGASAIPDPWRARLVMADEIAALADRLREAGAGDRAE